MSGLRAHVALTRSNGFRVDVDLSIPPGSTVALLGPNGAGKSSVVAAIAGLLALEDGSIRLGGRILDDPADGIFVPPDRRRIGVVFQDYLLFPHLSAADNVAFGSRSRGMTRAGAEARARSWLERLGLEELGGRRPGDLSGGQAQRVALARALATEPDALLLDEPLAALDATNRVELRRALGDHLATFAGPRLLITHDPVEAFMLADEIHVVEDGVVTQSGAPDDIRLRPRTRYVADLAGANLMVGEAMDGLVTVGSHEIHIAEHTISGPVLLTIQPSAIAVHRSRPEGSPRNSWPTRIIRVEPLGDRVRLRVSDPVSLTVEVTREAAGALSLQAGSEVWVSVKATEVGVEVA